MVLTPWLLSPQHQHLWKRAGKAAWGTSSRTHGIDKSGSGPSFSLYKSYRGLGEPLDQKKFKRHIDQMQNAVFICIPNNWNQTSR